MVAKQPEPLRVGGVTIEIERLTYATIVLMSVLVVYDGWLELATFLGVVAVIIGPIVALGVAHFFSEMLHSYAAEQRPPAAADWRRHGVAQFQILLAALPFLVVLAVGWMRGLDAGNTITVLLWTGGAVLVLLATVAGRRAGLRGWRLLLTALGGGVVGLIVISLQILLKPH